MGCSSKQILRAFPSDCPLDLKDSFSKLSVHILPTSTRPHDKRLEQLTIAECDIGERSVQRNIAIRLRLLAPYHDGVDAVCSSQFAVPSGILSRTGNRPTERATGISYVTRSRLPVDGFIEHDITFAGSRFIIECADVEFDLGASLSCRNLAITLIDSAQTVCPD